LTLNKSEKIFPNIIFLVLFESCLWLITNHLNIISWYLNDLSQSYGRKCKKRENNFWTALSLNLFNCIFWAHLSLFCKVFFPAKFFSCILEKENLAGKNLLFKRVNSTLQRSFFRYTIHIYRNFSNHPSEKFLCSSTATYWLACQKQWYLHRFGY
jgi:hypothetical protein